MAPSLTTPVKIGDLALSNRIAMAPMTRGRAEGDTDWVASATMAEYYAQRAGAGLIITEATTISVQGEGWWRAPRIFTDKHAQAWKQVTEAVHAKGGKIVCQLWHTGRASHSSFRPDAKDPMPVGPSAIGMSDAHKMSFTPAGRVPYEVPRPLTTEEAERIPDQYQNAARIAKEAGFDGVEVHSANGYLLDTFLQSKTNHRDDKYGGSVENRSKLLEEVLQAVLKVWPASRVGVRISPNGAFNEMGSPDYREQFLYVAKMLSPYNLAYLHIMNGLGFGFHNLGTPMTLKEFRDVYDGIIMANCGYTLEQGENDVKEGLCDVVAYGRPYISNPDLAERHANGIELTPVPESMDLFYSPPGTNLGAKGYTDFPAATVAK